MMTLLSSNEIEQDVSSGYESLLKFADGNLNSIKLKWHYRSKYEDLITTSNNFIYKDLVTFPNSERSKWIWRIALWVCQTQRNRLWARNDY
nr:hypothetical protein [Mycoplasmopsis bovis]